MATQDIYIDYAQTNNIEAYFKALFILQRTPGAEDESASLAHKLKKEFRFIPERLHKGIASKSYENIKYFPSGKVALVSQTYGNRAYLLIEPYVSELQLKHAQKEDTQRLEKEETKRTGITVRKKNQSYGFLKYMQPIWYAQVMAHRGRKVNVSEKDQIQYQLLNNQLDLYHSLSEDERIFMDIHIINKNISNEAYKLHASFNFNFSNANVRTYGRNKSFELKEEHYRFFYLNENECEAIADAIEVDKISGHKYQDEDNTRMFTHTIHNILSSSDKNRIYIDKMSSDDIINKVSSSEGVHFKITKHKEPENHKEIWDTYAEKQANITKKQRHIAELFGLVPIKE